MQPRWDNDNNNDNNNNDDDSDNDNNNDNNNNDDDNDNAQPQLQTTLSALTIFATQQHATLTQLYNHYQPLYNSPIQAHALQLNNTALYYNELQHIMTRLLNDYSTLHDHYTYNHPIPAAPGWDSPVQPPLQHYDPMLPQNLPTVQRPLPQLIQPQIPQILTLSQIPTILHQQEILIQQLQSLTTQLDPSQLQLDYYAHTFNTLQQLHTPLRRNYQRLWSWTSHYNETN